MIITPAWPDYELITSGDGEKLERFGAYLLARPDPQILWAKRSLTTWNKAHTQFITQDDKGLWRHRTALPEQWTIAYDQLRFQIRLTAFRHTGLFPEQASNWEWIKQKIQQFKKHSGTPPKVLNLFAYTGGATLAALAAGAEVVHVDASKSSIEWAKENARLSGLSTHPVRWILDDALKFTQREGRRGQHYDLIIMDPPPFGRGAKGEIWRIENKLAELLTACAALYTPHPIGLILSAYATNYSATSFYNLAKDQLHPTSGQWEYDELGLIETDSHRVLPTGIVVRWSND